MKIIECKNLKVSFKNENKKVTAVNDVSFSLNKGEILGVVGESGSGKSVTVMSMMKLIKETVGTYEAGEIFFRGADLLKFTEKQMEQIRGNEIAAIYQEPLTALNPVYKIGQQITEAILKHKKVNKGECEKLVIKLLNDVGISNPEKIFKSYPNELSGGMRQRVLIAMALCCNPEILIADEPTTALDVTIQAQILELIKKIKDEYGMSIIIITHDLSVIAELCDRVVVMYSGKVVEEGNVFELFDNPKHPYTKALMKSKPNINLEFSGKRKLNIMKGQISQKEEGFNKCYFIDRCEECEPCCNELAIPEIKEVGENHLVACHLVKR
ncbi:MAG: ABC transporter ATP-binding protein [Sarcina sp.]